MLLTDFHIHSDCSPDAFCSMTDMAKAAQERGVGLLCFTDHCDLDWYQTGEEDFNCFNYWPDALKLLDDAHKALPDKPEVRIGVELGEANHHVERAEKIASTPELDFVLGSLHSLRGLVDFYCQPYYSLEHCRELLHTYLAELTEIAKLPFVDSIAHIGYTRRYMHQAGYDIKLTMAEFGDEIDLLFDTAIENGKGIELNTSGLRNSLVGETIPSAELLARYKERGGEIITIGSDAHKTEDAGAGLREGVELLQSLGFKYITAFKKRKAEFIEIK